MDDTGLTQAPDELPELSVLSTDIPAAVREAEPPPLSVNRHHPGLWLAGSTVALCAVVVPLVLVMRSMPWQPNALSQSSSTFQPVANPSPTPNGGSTTETSASDAPELLGHRRYLEAPTSELVPVAPDGVIYLRRSAAQKLEEMIAAAAKEGVSLIPLSGFRSEAEQTQLFFEVKAKRGEEAKTRAEVSAPPGYSEHHTGYAVDLGDGDSPSTDLQMTFEETKAFRWLKDNAAFYSFELSFPKNNPMQISYEPWHWRFVGDRQSLETFYQARPDLQQATDGAVEPLDASKSGSNPTSSSTANPTSSSTPDSTRESGDR
ncbi:MAG: D-alanyl-D-alanine carboxypeptidase family protein [Elainella sp. Prado103]|nr:D-alanyl-D-alanine carboxypeptidase family protein [Elainella sp. Prado103]